MPARTACKGSAHLLDVVRLAAQIVCPDKDSCCITWCITKCHGPPAVWVLRAADTACAVEFSAVHERMQLHMHASCKDLWLRCLERYSIGRLHGHPPQL